ncbi:MAG: FdtA/QdtA family cupin domain-containing protein [Muribaculaceae bacterium]|nr:FdtA/QdtA family cupin domain-containing protein [Muribaculaceae bacterium]
MNRSSVYDCSVIELDCHSSDRRGNMSVVENGKSIPFDVRRVYYLYDVPGGVERGGHAHRSLYQLIIAVSGSFSVTLDDGKLKRTVFLNRPNRGLLVVPGLWRTIEDFSSGAVCMVLASSEYDEEDYIRDYGSFLNLKN